MLGLSGIWVIAWGGFFLFCESVEGVVGVS